MKQGIVTSAVEGVGSSRRENTSTKGGLKSFVNPCKKGTFPTKYLSSICNPTNVCLQVCSNAKGPITGCNMVQKEIKL